jgi:hypothetical protein
VLRVQVFCFKFAGEGEADVFAYEGEAPGPVDNTITGTMASAPSMYPPYGPKPQYGYPGVRRRRRKNKKYNKWYNQGMKRGWYPPYNTGPIPPWIPHPIPPPPTPPWAPGTIPGPGYPPGYIGIPPGEIPFNPPGRNLGWRGRPYPPGWYQGEGHQPFPGSTLPPIPYPIP